MNTISFITANFVAREIGYNMTDGWMQGDTATQQHYQSLETFPARFDGMLREIRALGFNAIDLWAAHLHPAWATPAHIAAARDALQANGLRVTSLAA
ncbi:MAG: sugar phosphate isomerase/epimerase, partial [Pleurocapsa sp. SU_196_0]|nr:sugar phosphate isomerase/epimerase [Pleurocapsa sp. SU_196_0]